MKHFKLEELTASQTALKMGLDNTPTSEHQANLVILIEELLDPLRDAWAEECTRNGWKGVGIIVTSGYRGFRLNKAVKGSQTSAHCIGCAADTVPANGRMREYKEFCKRFLPTRKFDQLISEDENSQGVPRWMHIGYKNREGQQRRQFLIMQKGSYRKM